MPQIAGRLTDIYDVWVNQSGEAIRLNLGIGEQGPLDLELTPATALALLAAIVQAAQQSEARRDAAAASGHLIPHPFLPVQNTAILQAILGDRVGVRVFSQNMRLDFAMPLDVARALRDQLDANIAHSSRPAGAPH
jgi:hypothetical protein